MTAAAQLSLESLGVDIAAMAQRLSDSQTATGRDDDACARLAGVTLDRFRAWKEAREKPGVARLPSLAVAVNTTVANLMFGAGAESSPALVRATDRTRRASQLMADLMPACDTITRLANEIAHDEIPIVGGRDLGDALATASQILHHADAVPRVAQSTRIDA